MTHQTFTPLGFFGCTLRKQYLGKNQRQENLRNQTILQLTNSNIHVNNTEYIDTQYSETRHVLPKDL